MFHRKRRAADRASRRTFLKSAAGVGALGIAGNSLLAKNAFAQRGALDPDVLNFALNLEYLGADFYTLATQGVSIENVGLPVTGQGTPGGVVFPPNPRVPFASADVASLATELAADERGHVVAVRSAVSSLGVTPIARPAQDLQNSFLAAGNAMGVSNFNPFANDLSFLLAAFMFEDVCVTALKGGSRLLTNKDVLEAAAGMLAAEAYQAAALRTLLFQQRDAIVPNSGNQTVAQIVQRLSNLRDSVDALNGSGTPGEDLDQGIVNDNPFGTTANIVPTDSNAIAFSRTPASVLRIVYLGGALGVGGGFFPSGVNGAIR